MFPVSLIVWEELKIASMKIYIARVFAYATASENAKGAASIGMSVSSKLNGTQDWVGTYDPTAELGDRRVGFITNPNKFSSLETAEKAAELLAKKYPRGAELDPTKWGWGREMLESGVDGVWSVTYKGHDVAPDPEAVTASRVAAAAPAQ